MRAAVLTAFSLSVLATSAGAEQTVLPAVVVSERLSSGPGASPRVRAEKEATAARDVHQVLSKTPGVIVQEEDAHGLRPNISLRGVAPHRSRKVTLLEDGLLIGPAPYSAPAAYYTPSLARTRGLDVLRGFRAVPFGPNSVGGAVDYLTWSLPQEDFNQLQLLGGSFATAGVQGRLGRVFENSRVLFLVDHLRNEGFKKLPDGGGTGFQKTDLLLKGEWSPADRADLIFDYKLGGATESSDETYLGLTAADFDADPSRRYAASEGDLMSWRHHQLDLGVRKIADDGEWRARAYFRAFWRNWHRFNGFMDSARDVSEILRDPTGGNEVYADILRGRQDSSVLGGGGGELDVVNNERSFLSRGLLLERAWEFTSNDIDVEVRIGALLHGDSIQRHHTRDVSVIEQGHRVSTGRPLVELTRDQQQAEARVLRSTLKTLSGPWTSVLSLRHENVDYDSRNELTGASFTSGEHVTLPGVGFARAFADHEVFVAASQGATLRGVDRGSSQEISFTREMGYRHSGSDSSVELVVFDTSYDRLKGVCSFASGCTDNSRLDVGESGGGARITGLEAAGTLALETNWGTWTALGTWTSLDARFVEGFTSTLSEWGDGVIDAGDPLPYVPASQFSATFAHETARVASALTLRWQGEMFDQSVREDRRSIPAHGVLDARVTWRPSATRELSVKWDNLLNNAYLASYRPFGARPGKPQSLLIGFTQKF